MKVTDNELLIIYRSTENQDKEALSYGEALQHHKLKTLDAITEDISVSQLTTLANEMNVGVHELIDKNVQEYKQKYGDADLGDDDVLKLLGNNPSFLKTPIVKDSQRTYFLGSAKELINKDMQSETITMDAANPEEKKPLTKI